MTDVKSLPYSDGDEQPTRLYSAPYKIPRRDIVRADGGPLFVQKHVEVETTLDSKEHEDPQIILRYTNPATLAQVTIRLGSHRAAVTAPLPDVAQRVQEVLTPHVTAYITGVKTTKSIRHWLTGKGTRPETEAQLRTAFQVVEMLSTLESEQTIRTWFIAANPFIGDKTPMEALREGKHAAVLAAATHFVDNG